MWSPSPDEPDKWRGVRKPVVTGPFAAPDRFAAKFAAEEHVASVERADGSDLLGLPRCYSAEVAGGHGTQHGFGWRTAPVLFGSLKKAQLWCELEVRLMEVRELV